MSAPFNEPKVAPHVQRGFTMLELVVVIVILGAMSIYVAPRLNLGLDIRNDAWLDQVTSAVRFARDTAVSHRRLVCMTVGASSVSLRIASTNPASSCDTDLAGPDGTAAFISDIGGSGSLTISPVNGGLVYFQPNGKITTNGAGTTLTNRTIYMDDTPGEFITLYPETGHVEMQ
jgi:prepilin-type N-terminal cleavage/methylation domain-containing protein